ncbi:MAG: dihydroneopterin aldolase [Chitinophagaceae bacterium]|nr:dihydroneopterin aldolase [Chitinophagaceae bacterium]
MLSIRLNNLLFYAYHGLYEAERIIGNEFEVNITILQYEVKETISSINETINYAAIYELVALRMKQPTLLLETVAQDICKLILKNFSLVDNILVSIKKLHPPITSFQGNVEVCFEMKRM